MAFGASLHIDIAEVQTAEGKLFLFVAIDRTSKFAVVQLVEKANRKTAWEFLEHLLEVVPYRIHTILTEPPEWRHRFKPDGGGIQFAEQPRNRNTPYPRPMRFDMISEGQTGCKRRPRPSDFALARCREGAKRRAAGSSSRTTRRGPYEPLTCWTYAHGIRASMSRSRWPLASFVNRSCR